MSLTQLEKKILAVVAKEEKVSDGLFVHNLLKALNIKKSDEFFSLHIARQDGAPFWLSDLPPPVFTSLLKLSEMKLVSFTPVSAQTAALAVEMEPQVHPLISLSTAKSKTSTFFLPMRMVSGSPPGSGGFMLVGEGSSRFDWHVVTKTGAKKQAPKKSAAKKKPAPLKKVAIKSSLKRAAPEGTRGKLARK